MYDIACENSFYSTADRCPWLCFACPEEFVYHHFYYQTIYCVGRRTNTFTSYFSIKCCDILKKRVIACWDVHICRTNRWKDRADTYAQRTDIEEYLHMWMHCLVLWCLLNVRFLISAGVIDYYWAPNDVYLMFYIAGRRTSVISARYQARLFSFFAIYVICWWNILFVYLCVHLKWKRIFAM